LRVAASRDATKLAKQGVPIAAQRAGAGKRQRRSRPPMRAIAVSGATMRQHRQQPKHTDRHSEAAGREQPEGLTASARARATLRDSFTGPLRNGRTDTRPCSLQHTRGDEGRSADLAVDVTTTCDTTYVGGVLAEFAGLGVIESCRRVRDVRACAVARHMRDGTTDRQRRRVCAPHTGMQRRGPVYRMRMRAVALS